MAFELDDALLRQFGASNTFLDNDPESVGEFASGGADPLAFPPAPTYEQEVTREALNQPQVTPPALPSEQREGYVPGPIGVGPLPTPEAVPPPSTGSFALDPAVMTEFLPEYQQEQLYNEGLNLDADPIDLAWAYSRHALGQLKQLPAAVAGAVKGDILDVFSKKDGVILLDDQGHIVSASAAPENIAQREQWIADLEAKYPAEQLHWTTGAHAARVGDDLVPRTDFAGLPVDPKREAARIKRLREGEAELNWGRFKGRDWWDTTTNLIQVPVGLAGEALDEWTDGAISDYLSKQTMGAQIAAQMKGDEAEAAIPEYDSDLVKLFAMAGASTGANVPGLGIGLTAQLIPQTRAFAQLMGLGSFSLISSSLTSQDLAEEGVDTYKADTMQKIKAVSEPLTELPSFRSALQMVGSRSLQRLGRFLLEEVGMEMVETAIDNLATWAVVNPDMGAQEGMDLFWRDLLTTAAVAPIAAGGQGIAIGGLTKGLELGEKAIGKGQKLALNFTEQGRKLKEQLGELSDVAGATAEIDLIRQNLRSQLEAAVAEGRMVDNDRLESLGLFKDVVDPVMPITDPQGRGLFSDDLREDTKSFLNRRFKVLEDTLQVRSADGRTGTLASLGAQPGERFVVGEAPATRKIRELELYEQENPGSVNAKVFEELQADAVLQEKLASDLLEAYGPILEQMLPGRTILFNIGTPQDSELYNILGMHDGANQEAVAEAVYTLSKDAARPLAMLSMDHNTVATAPQGYNASFARAAENMAHEIGHMWVQDQRETMAQEFPGIEGLLTKTWVEALGKGLQEGRKTGRLDGLSQMMNAPHQQEVLRADYPEGLEMGLEKLRAEQLEEGRSDRTRAGYYFGREEFLANEFAKMVLGDETFVQGELKEALKDWKDGLQALYDRLEANNLVPTEGFVEYALNSIAYNQLGQANEKYAQKMAEMERVLDNIATLKPSWMGPRQLTKMLISTAGGGSEAALTALTGKFGDDGTPMSPDQKHIKMKEFGNKMEADATKFTVITRMFAGMEQIMRMNPQFKQGQDYKQGVWNFWTTKSRWTAKATDVVKDLRKHLGTAWLDNSHEQDFGAAMFEIDRQEQEKGGRLSAEEMEAVLQKYKMDDSDVAMMNRLWDLYKEALNEIEEGLIKHVTRLEYKKDTVDANKLEKDIADIRKDFAKMRARHYVPHTRFGPYHVVVKAAKDFEYQGTKYKKGEVITRAGADDSSHVDVIIGEMARKYTEEQVHITSQKVSDEFQSLQGIHPELAYRLADMLNFSDAQRQELREFLVKSGPGQSIRKHMLQRKGIAGYSEDIVRVTADYFSRFASHIARVNHAHEMEDAITDALKNRRKWQARNPWDFLKHKKRDDLIAWMQRHYQYLMDPGEELATLRAAGFFWYLAFNPKSAVVNMTQVPFVTGPYLSARFGWIQTTKAMTTAMADIGEHFALKGYKKAKGEEFRSPLGPEVLEMWEELKARQLLDEGMTTMLAGLANDRTIIPARGKAGALVRATQETGAWMFQTAEKMNRYYTATAAYKLARKAGMTPRNATEFAAESVKATQLEYARFNRPEIMRGKTSVIFLFYQYLSQMMYFVGSDPARWRYLFMMLIMGGYTALPGAEVFLAIANEAAEVFKENLGLREPKTQLPAMISEFMNEVGHGASWLPNDLAAYFESGFMGNLPGPGGQKFDLQASISLGNPLIFDTAVIDTEGTIEEKVGRVAESSAGAPAEAALGILYGIFSEEPDMWRRMEKMMPTWAANVTKSTRRFMYQKEGVAGASPIEFDEQNPYGVTSWIAEGMGFARADIRRVKETEYMAKDAVKYYEMRSRFLRNEFYEMMKKKETPHPPSDRSWATFWRRVDLFNSGVGKIDARLKLHRGNLMKSYIDREKGLLRQEAIGHRVGKNAPIANRVRERRSLEAPDTRTDSP